MQYFIGGVGGVMAAQVLHGCLQLMLWNCGSVHRINGNPCFICKK